MRPLRPADREATEAAAPTGRVVGRVAAPAADIRDLAAVPRVVREEGVKEVDFGGHDGGSCVVPRARGAEVSLPSATPERYPATP